MLRKRILSALLSICLAAGIAGPAYAGESGTLPEAPDSGGFYEFTPPETGTPDLEHGGLDAVDEYPAESSGIFQNGAFHGPQTVPGEPASRSAVTGPGSNWQERAYALILNAWRERRPTVNVEHLGIPQDQIDLFWEVCNLAVNDHPELFYARGYDTAYFTNGVIANLDLVYNDLSNIDQDIQAFNAAVQKALYQVRDARNDLEKLLILHDYIAVNCRYTWSVATGQEDNDPYAATHHPWDAYGVLVLGDAVCQGYALAYKYLLSLIGIDCVLVTSDPLKHAWNAVRLDGQLYHVDITWDDPVPNTEGLALHNFFLLSDNTLFTGRNGTVSRHYDWVSPVSCYSTYYEQGWAYNRTNKPLHFWNGFFYYLTSVNEPFQVNESWSPTINLNVLYKTSELSQEGERLPGSLGPASSSALWAGDYVFVTPNAWNNSQTAWWDNWRIVLAYHLPTGSMLQACTYPYTPSPSSDGYYTADNAQHPGLRYYPEKNLVLVISPTAPNNVIAAFPIGGGVPVYGTEVYQNSTLYLAYYNGGRLAGVRSARVQNIGPTAKFFAAPEAVLAYPDLSSLPQHDSANMLLLLPGSIPAGPPQPIS